MSRSVTFFRMEDNAFGLYKDSTGDDKMLATVLVVPE
jgi:hypothetical protein